MTKKIQKPTSEDIENVNQPPMTLAEWQASCVPMPPIQFATKEQIEQFKKDCNVSAFIKGLIMLKGLNNGNRE